MDYNNEKEDEVLDKNISKISLLWAVLSVQWIGLINNLQATWTSIIATLLTPIILAAICGMIITKPMKKICELYEMCRYDIRKTAIKTAVVKSVSVYIVGILLMQIISFGLPILYSSIALAVGLTSTYKHLKNHIND